MSYLDFVLDARLVQSEIFGARVHFDGRTVEARRPSRIAVLTSRIELDAYLVEKAVQAGVEVVQNARVVRAEHDRRAVAVHTSTQTFHGRYLIGADGAQSAVARLMRPRWPRSQYAVTYECDVPSRPQGAAVIERDVIDIHFGPSYMGYGWVFPKRDHVNVGIGALASRAGNVKTATLEFTRALVERDSGREPRNAVGWIIPAGGYRRPVAAGRVMLAGDAAGFVDPFLGEGIAYAILSGATAGRLAGDAARTDAQVEQAAASYSSFCRQHIEPHLRYGLLFAKLLHTCPGLLRLFSTNRALLEKYLDVPAAQTTYREYFRWFVPRAIAAFPKAWLSA